MFAFLRHHSRFLALLLLVLQLGIVAHRLEHYLAPDHMESSAEGCDSFAPITDPPALPPLVQPPSQVAFYVHFWTVRDIAADQLAERLGFRAQAPPA